MGHPLGENVAARSFSRSQNVSPPLVSGFMGRHQEGDVRLRVAAGEEADPLGKSDVGGKALGVRGKTRELAQFELLPRIRTEPLGIVFPGRVDASEISSML